MKEDICTLVGKHYQQGGGKYGSIKCAVLYACYTMKLEKRQKEAGMSHIVWWKTSVHGETAARALCRAHLNDAAASILVQQSKDRLCQKSSRSIHA